MPDLISLAVHREASLKVYLHSNGKNKKFAGIAKLVLISLNDSSVELCLLHVQEEDGAHILETYYHACGSSLSNDR